MPVVHGMSRVFPGNAFMGERYPLEEEEITADGIGNNFLLWRMMNSSDVRSKMFVSRSPGDGGKDWEYVRSPLAAQHFSDYHKRKFFAYCRKCGDKERNYGAM